MHVGLAPPACPAPQPRVSCWVCWGRLTSDVFPPSAADVTPPPSAALSSAVSATSDTPKPTAAFWSSDAQMKVQCRVTSVSSSRRLC